MTKEVVEEMSVKRLAEAILKTQDLYEESFNKESAGKVMQGGMADEDDYPGSSETTDYSRFYELTLEQAAEKACQKLEVSAQTLVTLLCKIGWNDFQGWAKDTLGR
jgi:hypothetical protein